MRPHPLKTCLLAAACAAATPLAAQPYSPETLPVVLKVQAENAVTARRAAGETGLTLGDLVSFTAGGFSFAAQPALHFQRAGSYAYYVMRCGPGSGGLSALPPPALTPDTSLVMEVPRTIPGLSFLNRGPATPQPPDPLTVAWAGAATAGRAKLDASPIVLPPPPIQAPVPDPGYVILTVTPFFPLKDASYQVSVSLGAFTVSDPQNGSRMAFATADPVPVAGQLSGGRWAQGGGMLFIPAPQALPATSCNGGYFVTALSDAQLAALGIGTSFKATPAMSYQWRDTAR